MAMTPNDRNRPLAPKPERAAPTIKHIASAAGVSVATVSLALREHPKIPPATRARIATIAGQLGYRPNPLVATLMRQIRSGRPRPYQGSIAFLNLGAPESHALYRSDYFRAIHCGAVKQAARHGYRLETFCVEHQNISGRRLTSILRARDIHGILVPPLPDPQPLTGIDWSCFSAVALSHSLTSPRMHRVCPNHYDNMAMLLGKLKEAGYRRVGLYLCQEADDRCNRFWSSAFLRYQFETPESSRVPLLLSEQWSREPFLDWQKREKPDAIVCSFAESRLWLEEAGYPAPDKIGFAMPNSHPCYPDVSRIDECPDKIGADACDLLVLEISCGNRGIPSSPKMLSIPGRWQPGKTTRSRA